MKELLLGNEAVARGLYEAGVRVVSSYPGTPSTEITEAASQYDEIFCEWAPNEKVAAEVAAGASFGGARSFCAMKHVGLNVAADPLFTMSYIGVNGGMVLGVADDPGLHSSQNEQDSRNYAIAAKLPMLEPADSAECKQYAKLAYELSEQFDTPVILRLTTRVSHSRSIVELGERAALDLKPYEKNPAKNVMLPAFAKPKHHAVEARTEKLREWSEASGINTLEDNHAKIGIITAGVVYQYAHEVLGDSVSYLKLGMVNPLPDALLRDFASRVETVYVIEELDDIIETHCKKIGLDVHGKDTFPRCGEFSQAVIAKCLGRGLPQSKAVAEAIPVRPPVMCCGCPHRGLFYELKKHKVYVSGDIGCYTLGASAPLSAMDTCVCMGASVSALHGYNKARGPEAEHKSVAVIGDSTFIHSGITGLIDIAYNRSNSVVIVLDNSITGMTGHQQNPTTGYTIKGDPTSAVDLEALCHAVGIQRVRVCDPYDLKSVDQALKEELAADGPSVIISRRPCALLKYVKAKPPLRVDTERCIGCKACMGIGCPAISMRGGRAAIDQTQCVGCGVCTDLCPKSAICAQEVKE
ncbi:indolepyruvate ferredoxin oxidoreductase subunit alpha [Hydrogeniiclostridium mannosilyticum]|uniref:Indolepyruvate oxidoreductase subunit IorA n=1 Tax=Hydrogeniiclostridium mannosilyticum TaxID=2764322 RepID=A0A328UIW6_9FIRM|nr:indolepyruvate ferredoxin oxidoreductase subunit alpha [Hydrogeniiclostridium mannosilyticum]RAQ30662.1 indolepyruvate ferredoxin oxidoreductase subunit alpha [Hydrogeniiclostridium mannosilyticum]